MQPVVSIAHARVGLLGNPSDGYGGKAIALAIANFGARVTVETSDRFELKPGPSDGITFPSARHATRSFAAWGPDDGLRLLRAALKRFAGESKEFASLGGDDPLLRFSLRYETDIPRQVGLAGSSAIVVATLRALCDWFGSRIEPARLAELALSAEVEDLGIAAGPMDRVIQAYGGLMVMDLKEPRGPGSYQALDPAWLPPLFVAWDPGGGEPSGRAHGNLRSRWLAGDPEVLEKIAAFRKLVDQGVVCLRSGDHERFCDLMNTNFEMRTAIFDVSRRDHGLVAIAREQGGAAKLCGSGGAVVGTAGREDLGGLEARYRAAGFGFVRASAATLP